MSDWLVLTQNEMVDLLYQLNDELADDAVAADRRKDVTGLIAFFLSELRSRAGEDEYPVFTQVYEGDHKRLN